MAFMCHAHPTHPSNALLAKSRWLRACLDLDRLPMIHAYSQQVYHNKEPTERRRSWVQLQQNFRKQEKKMWRSHGKVNKRKKTIYYIQIYTSILSIRLPIQLIYTTVFVTNISSSVSSSYPNSISLCLLSLSFLLHACALNQTSPQKEEELFLSHSLHSCILYFTR